VAVSLFAGTNLTGSLTRLWREPGAKNRTFTDLIVEGEMLPIIWAIAEDDAPFAHSNTISVLCLLLRRLSDQHFCGDSLGGTCFAGFCVGPKSGRRNELEILRLRARVTKHIGSMPLPGFAFPPLHEGSNL
jgi:hypothetical protein